MTRAEARAYFWDKGLTYADISRTDLVYLLALLDLHFMKQRTEKVRAGLRPYWVRTHLVRTHLVRARIGEWTETGALNCAFLVGNGGGRVSREIITFLRGGSISFCSGVGDENTAPVLAAFVEWCDAMAEYKAMKKEDEDG